MPAASKMGNICVFNMFIVVGNTRRAADDLPLGECKAAYHLLMLRMAQLYCANVLQPFMSLCRATSPTSNQNEGGPDPAAHQVHTALSLTFAAAVAQAALTAINSVSALSDTPNSVSLISASLSSLCKRAHCLFVWITHEFVTGK